MTGYATGTAAKSEEEKMDENAARKCYQPASNRVDQARGELNTIFGGGNSWGNDSVPPLSPCKMGIPRGADIKIMQQATTFLEGGNAPTAGTIA